MKRKSRKNKQEEELTQQFVSEQLHHFQRIVDLKEKNVNIETSLIIA